MERESERIQSEIEDKRISHHQRASKDRRVVEFYCFYFFTITVADAAFYAAEKAAQANQLLYTKEYVQLELARNIANNTKVYFGDSLTSML